jgi:oxygen-independent coproporphyrinogen-3 oxidase
MASGTDGGGLDAQLGRASRWTCRISRHTLIYEEGTPWIAAHGGKVCRGRACQRRTLNLLIDRLERRAIFIMTLQFRPPGYFSNKQFYWNETKYLGIGPFAHSYDGKAAVECGLIERFQAESIRSSGCWERIIDEHTRYNEYIIKAYERCGGSLGQIEIVFGRRKIFLSAASRNI